MRYEPDRAMGREVMPWTSDLEWTDGQKDRWTNGRTERIIIIGPAKSGVLINVDEKLKTHI